MDRQREICHNIVNCLNCINIVAGVLRDSMREKPLAQDLRDEISHALERIEAASAKANVYLDELRSLNAQQGKDARS
jgi:hypothetical protein